MTVQQVRSEGIYHGLPVYDDSIQGLTAIVTGANGISGYPMLQVLGQSPTRWKKIYCLSRRPPLIHGEGALPANAEHVAMDFLKSPEEIAATLKEKGVQADHVFFYAYMMPEPEEGEDPESAMTRVNAQLLGNFLEALKRASITPKRFMLQTGAKYYGVHLGATKVPQKESAPRLTNAEFGSNFYYAQEDLLFRYGREEGVGWTVTMPNPILGAVPDAAMNLAFPLAIYAAVCGELKEPLEYPSDINAWQRIHYFSTSTLNAHMAEWTVLTPEARDQRFNTNDDSPFTWESFWPQLAGWYGAEWTGPDPEATFTEEKVPHNPRGYGPNAVMRVKGSLVDWAKRPIVQQTWIKLAERHGLVGWPELKEPERIFGFPKYILAQHSTVVPSMDKSKKMGWRGFVDTNESLFSVLDGLAKLKMIPPVSKKP